MTSELVPVLSEEGMAIMSEIVGHKVEISKPKYELHFAIKAVVWEDGTVSWEHASEMYESAYPNGVVWDNDKCEWNFYREDNETMESKCHNKLSDHLVKMSVSVA